jgi:hypothetical protein
VVPRKGRALCVAGIDVMQADAMLSGVTAVATSASLFPTLPRLPLRPPSDAPQRVRHQGVGLLGCGPVSRGATALGAGLAEVFGAARRGGGAARNVSAKPSSSCICAGVTCASP